MLDPSLLKNRLPASIVSLWVTSIAITTHFIRQSVCLSVCLSEDAPLPQFWVWVPFLN